MRSKPSKRYACRNEIIRDIDFTVVESDRRSIEAESKQAKADEMIKQSAKEKDQQKSNLLVFEAKKLRSDVVKIKRRVARYKTKLKRLQNTLAAFDTEAMAFLDDKSVVLQGQ